MGREWTLRVTLGHRSALREAGVDTENAVSAMNSLSVLTGMDAAKLAQVCRILTVEPVTMTPDEYEAGWDGPTIEAAGDALAEAVLSFYLGRQPKVLAAVREKVTAAAAAVDAAMAAGLTSSVPATNSPAFVQ